MSKSKLKLIIFDLDGTLVDAFSAVTRSLNYMFRKIGYPIMDRETVQRQVGWGETSLIRAFVEEEELPRALRIYRKHHKDALKQGVKFLPGAKSVLKRLKKEGYQLAIASNRPSRFTRIILRELDIRSYFSHVICADQARHKKPHPDMLKQILAKLQVKPSEAIYVGDMTIDVQAGKRARMKTVAVLTGSSSRREIRASNPNKIITKIAQVMTFIEKN